MAAFVCIVNKFVNIESHETIENLVAFWIRLKLSLVNFLRFVLICRAVTIDDCQRKNCLAWYAKSELSYHYLTHFWLLQFVKFPSSISLYSTPARARKGDRQQSAWRKRSRKQGCFNNRKDKIRTKLFSRILTLIGGNITLASSLSVSILFGTLWFDFVALRKEKWAKMWNW